MLLFCLITIISCWFGPIYRFKHQITLLFFILKLIHVPFLIISRIVIVVTGRIIRIEIGNNVCQRCLLGRLVDALGVVVHLLVFQVDLHLRNVV